ncbi:palmitoyltransferase akr1 [Zygosaccharomyces mellis]|uniref:Palmitoyltransferase n=1 Tax=Zygosaccharomyces mellis TaxID=42258 RepID=A0A4C2E5X8_9SACH|nr:palmitoyltransferase akr1 [Zygosaccharomyces mellis]
MSSSGPHKLDLDGSQQKLSGEDGEAHADEISLSSMKPILSGDEGQDGAEVINAEPDEISSSAVEGPEEPLDRFMSACQRGDLATVEEVVNSGQVDINYDLDKAEHVTGLHWASINNRLGVVDFLVSRGADVNIKAGNLQAPPLHWAARYGYVYIVHYLLEHGANPQLTDDQGFNLLHLSVNSSNIMLVLYVLFFVVDRGILEVDGQDPYGRTPLLWAAYQGDSLTVDSLLKFGSYTKVADHGGFTPLHWGTLKGQPHVLIYLLQNGGDVFQKTNDGKDCFIIAQEMNTMYSLVAALQHCGFDENGYPIRKLFREPLHAKIITFFIPWVFLGVVFASFSHVHFLFALSIMILFGFAIGKLLNKYILPCYAVVGVSSASLLRSPLYAGLFTASIIWPAFVWISRVIPRTIEDQYSANVLMMIIIVAVPYLLVVLMRSDPGRIPMEMDIQVVRETIKDLLAIGRFDSKNFCIETWVRKPLRSRFSGLSNSLVARFDHYCPWVYNDIGLRNHKTFLTCILLVEILMLLFIYLCTEYFDELEDILKHTKDGDKPTCTILKNEDLCLGFTYDPFAFLMFAWVIFHSIWVGLLVIVQLFQVFQGITNHEFSKIMKESRKNGADPVSFNEFFGTAPEELLISNGLRDNTNPVRSSEVSLNQTVASSRSQLKKSRTCFGICCALTGVDQWLMVIKETFGISHSASGTKKSLTVSSPTNYGWKTNWKDFWLTSDTTAPVWRRILFPPTTSRALLGGQEVDYYKLFSLPPRGN